MVFTAREIEELNRSAEQLPKTYTGVRNEIPGLEIKQIRGEDVQLYQRVEAYISSVFPKSKHESIHHYNAISETWARLRAQALKRAKTAVEDSP